ncbi:5'-nucleotidase/UDP-sugar diphosphatase [Clostridiales Family XIII bacterium PM5-7]
MKKIWSKLLLLAVVVTMVLPTTIIGSAAPKQEDAEQITIVFSHDMHSHLEQFGKLHTIIKEETKSNGATFALDGGDFAMGTPYQTIFKVEAAELRMMGQIGFDATTLGNHEFDYRSSGLSAMLNTAKNSGDPLPELVISNIDWEGTLDDPELADNGKNLKEALENYGAKSYTVLEKGGARIAVFGIFGKEADSFAPESGTLFLDPVETAKKVVAEIQENEEVDLIVCLSHSGTDEDYSENSEDEILAKEVDGIDLIVSGHSHTKLEEPIIHNDTVVASAGQYNDHVGIATFIKDGDQFQMEGYTLIPLDETVSSNEKTMTKVNQFKTLVDRRYFSLYNYQWDDVLAKNSISFTDIETFGQEQKEDTLGNLISDSYIYGVKEAEGDNYKAIDVAVVPSGVVRGSFDQGDITVEDAYNVLSLGTGKDGKAGYPLVSVYLTGEELKLVAEVDASISPIMTEARLYLSGLNFTFNPKRLILSKAYDVYLDRGDGKTEALEDDQLYRVVADLYSAQMLGVVNSMSYGLLSLVPKDENGNELTNYEDQIIYNPDGTELKEWLALARYIDSFSGNQVPERYAQTENRKIIEDSSSISDLLKKPSKFFWIIVAVVVLILALIALCITLIVRKVKRGKGSTNRMKRKEKIFSHNSGRYH